MYRACLTCLFSSLGISSKKTRPPTKPRSAVLSPDFLFKRLLSGLLSLLPPFRTSAVSNNLCIARYSSVSFFLFLLFQATPAFPPSVRVYVSFFVSARPSSGQYKSPRPVPPPSSPNAWGERKQEQTLFNNLWQGMAIRKKFIDFMVVD